MKVFGIEHILYLLISIASLSTIGIVLNKKIKKEEHIKLMFQIIGLTICIVIGYFLIYVIKVKDAYYIKEPLLEGTYLYIWPLILIYSFLYISIMLIIYHFRKKNNTIGKNATC